MEPVTIKDSTDIDTSSMLPSSDNIMSSTSNGLYGLISIPIFAIMIGLLIIFLRKYGCPTLANFVRSLSNYMMDINVEIDSNITDHTPAEVNEALDNISTEQYGSSPVSSLSLSWDSRIQVEAERLSQIIRDDHISSKNSFLDKDTIEQATQTSIQDEDGSQEEDITTVNIDLRAPLSPMDLYPPFTASIQIDSDSDDDENTIPMKIIPVQNDDNMIEEEDMINPISNTDDNTMPDPVVELNNNNLSQVSCTRSGLVYK